MRYKRPDWILAAFYRKAFLLERLAQTIYEAPVPPEFKKKGAEEYLAAYQDALAQAAQPYEDQAVAVYVQAIEAARKLHVKNEWTKKIGESLARYRPREYPVLKEAKTRLVAEDLSPRASPTRSTGRRAARSPGIPPPSPLRSPPRRRRRARPSLRPRRRRRARSRTRPLLRRSPRPRLRPRFRLPAAPRQRPPPRAPPQRPVS